MPNGQGQITLIAEDGSDMSTLTVEGLFVSGVSWIPNGYLLVLADPRGDLLYRGGGDFYIIDPTGTILSQLTFCADEIAKGVPALSPDGDEILFSDGNGVSVLSLEDGRVQTIVPHEQFQWTFSANWSPDGQQVAFLEVRPPCAECNNTVRVMIVIRDGSNPRILHETHGNASEGFSLEVDSIGFSPDGEYVGFIDHGFHKVSVAGGEILSTDELVWTWLPAFFKYPDQ